MRGGGVRGGRHGRHAAGARRQVPGSRSRGRPCMCSGADRRRLRRARLLWGDAVRAALVAGPRSGDRRRGAHVGRVSAARQQCSGVHGQRRGPVCVSRRHRRRHRSARASERGRAAELVRPYARLPVMPSLAVVCLGSAERALGLAAATCADLDAAVVHLEEALRVDQLLGSRPMATLTESALAAVLTARGATGDADRAAMLAHAAQARAAQIGMKLPASPSWLARPRRTSHRVQLAPSAAGWKLSVDGRVTLLSGRIGTTYLAALLAAPSADVHVLQLVFGVDTTVNRTSLGQPVLDQHALRDLEKRVSELETAGDVDELEAIRATLRSATGRRGRPRDFPTDQERARTAVRKALRRAIDSIARTEPAFAEHLSRQHTTAFTSRYYSPPASAVQSPPPSPN